MDPTIELTLEQEFDLRYFTDLVQQMSLEQAQEFLVEQRRLMLLQKAVFQKLLKHEWKADGNFASL
jgi:hypothetical protein